MPAAELPLRDLHISAATSWWPPAIGWWLLAIFLVLLILLGFWLGKRLNQRRRLLKSATKRLAELSGNAQLGGNEKLSELSILLRRVAITVAADGNVAGLTGEAWLAYLDRNMRDSPFRDGIGRLLIEAPYRLSPPAATELDQLFVLCARWLKTCGRKPRSNKIS